MRITVFGATSTTGRLVVEQALAAGHEVTAFTRDAARIPATHANLRVAVGDVSSVTDCAAALAGADAVVITLGNGGKGVVREAGTRAVVEAMRQSGVRRLVCQSTLGVGSSWANLDFIWRRIMFGLLIRQAFRDHERQEEVVRASGLDWTIVRPSAFTDSEEADVKHGFGPDEEGLRLKVGRAQVAVFLLAQVTDGSRLGQAVSLSA